MFSCLLQHLAWKQQGPILIPALHKSVTYVLTYTLNHLLTAPGPTWAVIQCSTTGCNKDFLTYCL